MPLQTKQSAYFRARKQVRKSMVALITWGEGADAPPPMLQNVTAATTHIYGINRWIADWSPHAALKVSATGLLRSWSERSAELFSWPLIAPGESFHLPAWDILHSALSPFTGLLHVFCLLRLAVQNPERQVCTFGLTLNHLNSKTHLDIFRQFGLYLILLWDAS